MRNSSLWSDAVFEKEVILSEFDFETSSLEFEVSKSSIWKHTTLCGKGVFFFFESYLTTPKTNQAQMFTCLLFYAFKCWDTASEKTGLLQLPIVVSVFKVNNCSHTLQNCTMISQSLMSLNRMKQNTCANTLCAGTLILGASMQKGCFVLVHLCFFLFCDLHLSFCFQGCLNQNYLPKGHL